jgi:hypothetical protein
MGADFRLERKSFSRRFRFQRVVVHKYSQLPDSDGPPRNPCKSFQSRGRNAHGISQIVIQQAARGKQLIPPEYPPHTGANRESEASFTRRVHAIRRHVQRQRKSVQLPWVSHEGRARRGSQRQKAQQQRKRKTRRRPGALGERCHPSEERRTSIMVVFTSQITAR